MGTSPTAIGFIVKTAIEYFLGFASPVWTSVSFFCWGMLSNSRGVNSARPVVHPGIGNTNFQHTGFISASKVPCKNDFKGPPLQGV